MTLDEIETRLEKEIARAGEIFRNLNALKYEITEERKKRERVELRLAVRRRGRPSKFLQDIPTLEEQGLIPKAGETDGAQEAQQ
jgi:tripartite-type tricarboxylate transporter receptor subunit TctC